MSVQAGIWNLDGRSLDREPMDGISRATAEYGPDGETSYLEQSLLMLHRPFHTTSESRRERQPFVSAAGKVITWDGRLDNRDELIQDLASSVGHDCTDLDIVAALFDRFGTRCFARLIGDWALAVWNPREKELVLARDYMGIRQLFYYLSAQRLLWCSSLAALATSGPKFHICEEYIAGYLACHPDARLTPYQEIHSVPPGHFVHLRPASITTAAYWVFNPHSETRYKSDGEYEEHYRHLFRQAVRRRLRADVPILAELSGGIDSSSVVCMADDIVAEEYAQESRLDTFSYYDSNDPDDDDFTYFTRIEQKRGKKGIRADLNGCGSSFTLNEDFVATPGFEYRAELESAIRDMLDQGQYKVMLCGTGGDEMNGQALDPRALIAHLGITRCWPEMAHQVTALSLVMRCPWIQLFLESIGQSLPAPIRAPLTHQGKIDPWIDRKFARRYKLRDRQAGGSHSHWLLNIRARDAIETITTLARRMTYVRPSGIEKRYPYLDQNLVEFLTTIPFDQLLRQGQRRSLMRRALIQLVPSEVLFRRTKTSAVRCYSVTLEKNWGKLEQILVSPLVSDLGYADKAQFHSSLIAMKCGRMPPYFLRLLKLLSLELWLRNAESRGVISIKHVVPTCASIPVNTVENVSSSNDFLTNPASGAVKS